MPLAQPLARASSGFTLVELIAVVAAAGILSATALPRLTALGGEARHASLRTARGALMTVVASAHGQYMINGRATQALQDVTLPMVYGYPSAGQALADAAGLGGDFTVYGAGAGSMRIVPNDIAGTPRAADCYLVYTQGRDAATPPAVTLGATASAANCT